MSEKCCCLRVCLIDLLHAINRDIAEKPASSHQVTKMQKVSSQNSLLEKERDEQIDRQKIVSEIFLQ